MYLVSLARFTIPLPEVPNNYIVKIPSIRSTQRCNGWVASLQWLIQCLGVLASDNFLGANVQPLIASPKPTVSTAVSQLYTTVSHPPPVHVHDANIPHVVQIRFLRHDLHLPGQIYLICMIYCRSYFAGGICTIQLFLHNTPLRQISNMLDLGDLDRDKGVQCLSSIIQYQYGALLLLMSRSTSKRISGRSC